MADERERQIREHLEDGRYSWHTSPDIAYLLDALAAAREENGRLREALAELVEWASDFCGDYSGGPSTFLKDAIRKGAALARADDNGVPE